MKKSWGDQCADDLPDTPDKQADRQPESDRGGGGARNFGQNVRTDSSPLSP